MDALLHRRAVNTIKGLAMDAVQAANSGHPGMPMGMADVATVLWSEFLKFDGKAPHWPDRDRFVLSAGHGSMLLYAMLHLTGYDLSLDELKNFRQFGSKTPGHPEVHHTEGVETTTGPLGQGFANAVGMAIAERYLREEFGPELVSHHVYGICSDGDLMEGISSEAGSLAGHLGLGRLIMLYDDNNISIDGKTDLAFTEDVLARFEAQGWHTQRIDGHDPDAIRQALTTARDVTDKPSIIACRTMIGQGATFEGTEKVHGAALGVDDVKKTKERLGMDPEKFFDVPTEVADFFRAAAAGDEREAWEKRLADHPLAARFRSWHVPAWDKIVERIKWPEFDIKKGLATRKANAACVKAIYAEAPFLVGGSADLHESNGLAIGRPAMTPEKFAGTGDIHFGVREHAMGAICNGIVLHGGLRPYNATFLVFHDYQRPTVRLSALMGAPVIYIYSHDSILLGEDGPTHQPIDTLLALRAIPGLEVWRPGDATETAEAWKAMLKHTDGPSSIILTRQDLPVIDRSQGPSGDLVHRGGYVLADVKDPQVVLIGTGSELPLCVEAAQVLAERGIRARVASFPCRERFSAQDLAYRTSVLPVGVPRVAVEAAATLGWERWVGEDGAIIGIDRFGASAPMKVLAKEFGFTADRVASVAAGLVR